MTSHSPDGTAFLSGHADGTIMRYSFADDVGAYVLFAKHTCAPYALAWYDVTNPATMTSLTLLL